MPSGKPVSSAGIYVNLDKPDAVRTAGEIIKLLHEKGVDVRVDDRAAGKVGYPELGQDLKTLGARADMVIVLGGDGTLLAACRALLPHQPPLLGVNFGRLGFLTELEASEVLSELEGVVAGEYVVEARMMLQASVSRRGQQVCRFAGLNDVVVTKGPFARLIDIDLSVDGRHVESYACDGVIICTPTGSTAYSLSAGGPIVDPGVEVLVITPICPHTLYWRSLVVRRDCVVTLRVLTAHPDTVVTVDGQQGFGLKGGDEVTVFASPHTAHLVRRKNWDFYEVLRKKLKERDDGR